MRDIKFRAYSPDLKYMGDPRTLAQLMDRDFGGCFDPEKTNGIAEMSDCIYMQFTGMKDKNGKEIYEGDICETSHGKAQVLFSKRGGSFIWDIGYAGTYIIDAFRDENDDNLVEVIGNIYENQERLEKGKGLELL